MRAADRLCAGLRKAEVPDLALLNQVLYRARNVIDRHVRVNTVLVKQIYDVGLQPLEGSLRNRLNVRRTAVHAPTTFPCLEINIETELRCNDDSAPEGRERLPEKFLVCEGTVCFGGVEEGNSTLDSPLDQRDSRLLINGRAVCMA